MAAPADADVDVLMAAMNMRDVHPALARFMVAGKSTVEVRRALREIPVNEPNQRVANVAHHCSDLADWLELDLSSENVSRIEEGITALFHGGWPFVARALTEDYDARLAQLQPPSEWVAHRRTTAQQILQGSSGARAQEWSAPPLEHVQVVAAVTTAAELMISASTHREHWKQLLTADPNQAQQQGVAVQALNAGVGANALAADAAEVAGLGTLVRLVPDIYHPLHGQLAAVQELTFPRVVVLGGQHAGKSSTLERLAGVPVFPRLGDQEATAALLAELRSLCTDLPDNHVKTRLGVLHQEWPHPLAKQHTTCVPIQLQLAGDREQGAVTRIRMGFRLPGVNNGDEVEVRFGNQAELRIPAGQDMNAQCAQVRRRLILLQYAMSAEEGFCTEMAACLCVHIWSPGAPHLTLVDLPGFNNTVSTQARSYIRDMAQHHVGHQVGQPSTFALLVAKAGTDEWNIAGREFMDNRPADQWAIAFTRMDKLRATPQDIQGLVNNSLWRNRCFLLRNRAEHDHDGQQLDDFAKRIEVPFMCELLRQQAVAPEQLLLRCGINALRRHLSARHVAMIQADLNQGDKIEMLRVACDALVRLEQRLTDLAALSLETLALRMRERLNQSKDEVRAGIQQVIQQSLSHEGTLAQALPPNNPNRTAQQLSVWLAQARQTFNWQQWRITLVDHLRRQVAGVLLGVLRGYEFGQGERVSEESTLWVYPRVARAQQVAAADWLHRHMEALDQDLQHLLDAEDMDERVFAVPGQPQASSRSCSLPEHLLPRFCLFANLQLTDVSHAVQALVDRVSRLSYRAHACALRRLFHSLDDLTLALNAVLNGPAADAVYLLQRSALFDAVRSCAMKRRQCISDALQKLNDAHALLQQPQQPLWH